MQSTSGELGGARGRPRRPRAAIQANEAFMGCSMSYKKDERHSPKTRQNHVPGPFHETLKEYEAHRPTTALRADTARARPPWRAPSPKFLGWVRHASYCKRDRIQTAKHHSLSRRGPAHGPLTLPSFSRNRARSASESTLTYSAKCRPTMPRPRQCRADYESALESLFVAASSNGCIGNSH